MNAAINRIAEDTRFTTAHASLYYALFHNWNKNRFISPMLINRDEVRQIACIGGLKLYYKCITDLNSWGYIQYLPSRSFLYPSRVHMIPFDCTDDTTGDSTPATTGDSTPSTTDDSTSSTTGYTQSTLNRVPSINSINNKNITNKTNSINAYEQADANSDLPIGEYRNTGHRKGNRKTGKGAEQPCKPENLDQVVSYFEEKKSTGAEAEKFWNYFESVGWWVGGRSIMKDWRAAVRNWIANIPNYNSQKHDKNKVLRPQLKGKKNYAEPF